MPQIKKLPHCAAKFETAEQNRIVYQSLYCVTKVVMIKFYARDVFIPYNTIRASVTVTVFLVILTLHGFIY